MTGGCALAGQAHLDTICLGKHLPWGMEGTERHCYTPGSHCHTPGSRPDTGNESGTVLGVDMNGFILTSRQT